MNMWTEVRAKGSFSSNFRRMAAWKLRTNSLLTHTRNFSFRLNKLFHKNPFFPVTEEIEIFFIQSTIIQIQLIKINLHNYCRMAEFSLFFLLSHNHFTSFARILVPAGMNIITNLIRKFRETTIKADIHWTWRDWFGKHNRSGLVRNGNSYTF